MPATLWPIRRCPMQAAIPTMSWGSSNLSVLVLVDPQFSRRVPAILRLDFSLRCPKLGAQSYGYCHQMARTPVLIVFRRYLLWANQHRRAPLSPDRRRTRLGLRRRTADGCDGQTGRPAAARHAQAVNDRLRQRQTSEARSTGGEGSGQSAQRSWAGADRVLATGNKSTSVRS